MSQYTITVQDFLEHWPSPVVARTEVARATGGLISPKTLANLDSEGSGPPERLQLGRRIAYPSASFFEWVCSKLHPVKRPIRDSQGAVQ